VVIHLIKIVVVFDNPMTDGEWIPNYANHAFEIGILISQIRPLLFL
jgi:hypothetical protein